MRETVWEPLPRRAEVLIPDKMASEFADYAEVANVKSELVWGEHCSECSFPSCMSSCAFYTPRSDLVCRRFEFGIEPVEIPGAVLKRIRFRKWGKLEAQGPAPLLSPRARQSLDRTDRVVTRALTSIPAPFNLRHRLLHRWDSEKRKLASLGNQSVPTSFVVESWSTNGRSHPFTVTFIEVGGTRMYQEHFEIGPERRLHSISQEVIASQVNLGTPYLVQIEPVGDAAGIDVTFGILDFVAVNRSLNAAKPHASKPSSKAKPVKLVVWDLDNTIWSGTLVEDGPDGVTLKSGIRETLIELDSRGILNSIASKNDQYEALNLLTKLGLKDYFLAPQISWEPKSKSISSIASRLNLGTDSFVFVDDQAFERAEVSNSHPDVRTVSETAYAEFLDWPEFNQPVTSESRRRRLMYLEESERTAAKETTPGNYFDFLRASDITLNIRRLAVENLERAYELSQRTNQLNFCGTRYERAEVEAMILPSSELSPLVLSCVDKYGDYGTVGFATLNLEQGLVVDFFMSCRVQRKQVEHAFFSYVSENLLPNAIAELKVRYRQTSRNGASLALLKELGFTIATDTADPALWSRPLKEPWEDSDIVRVQSNLASRSKSTKS